jgi:hypothetical protein
VEIDFGDDDLTEKNPEGEENPDGPRRSERSTREPNWFGDRVVYLAADVSEEPKTLQEALTAPEAGEWRRAMERELESLKSNEVWSLTDLPQGKKIVGQVGLQRENRGGWISHTVQGQTSCSRVLSKIWV